MNKKGSMGSGIIFVGILLLVIALNDSFDWISFDMFGIDVSLIAIVIIAVILAFVGFFKKQNLTMLLSLLLVLIALNAGMGWFAFTFWKLDVASIALIILGIAFLYFGFKREKPVNSY